MDTFIVTQKLGATMVVSICKIPHRENVSAIALGELCNVSAKRNPVTPQILLQFGRHDHLTVVVHHTVWVH
jgi:hypothetical protein